MGYASRHLASACTLTHAEVFNLWFCLHTCRYQAVGYASRHLASACTQVMSDTMRLLLPEQAPPGDCHRNLVPSTILAHPVAWKKLHDTWRIISLQIVSDALKERGPGREAELALLDEVDSDLLDVKQRCMRSGCRKVRGNVILNFAGC